MALATWKNPAHYRRCQSKRAYRSLCAAEVQAERASDQTGELILAYTCCDCGSAHIGHADLSQQLARIPHMDRPCLNCGGTIQEAKKRKAERFHAEPLYCSERCQRRASLNRREARRALTTPAIGGA